MRIAICIACAVILILALAYFSFYFYKGKRNALAEVTVKGVVTELADYKNKNGEYPATFEVLPVARAGKQKVLFLFPPSDIHYKKTNDSYRIFYHIYPFGPFHGYDSKSNEWYYEE